MPLFPSCEESLDSIIETKINVLSAFSSSDWLIKVINQYPIYFIKQLIKRLSKYERISQFEKRNRYCKLLKIIQDNMNHPDAADVRYAFSLI